MGFFESIKILKFRKWQEMPYTICRELSGGGIMEVRELRLQTGLSQSKFAKMFDVPVSTLKDWEQERRNPPAYVVNMMRTILQYKGMLMSQSYVEACEARRKSVENAMAIMLSATNGPDELFLEVLNSYILGEITLEEMEDRIERFEYLGA